MAMVIMMIIMIIIIVAIIKVTNLKKIVMILRPYLRQIVQSITWNVVFNQEKARMSKVFETVLLE